MKRFLFAFFNSLAGLRWAFRNEAALGEEMVLLALSIPAGLLLTTDPWRLLVLWGVLALLLAIELLNTGIEKLADRITRDSDDLVRIAKDCGSAAVLMLTLISAGAWGIALWERLSE
ncbi:MAG: diacylglycerol kinase [Nitratireductor sp.]